MNIPLIAVAAALTCLAPAIVLAQNNSATAAPTMNPPIPPAPQGFDARRPEVAKGKTESVEYESKSIGVKRAMVIYTPAGYSTTTKYPVVYLLHGIGDDETGWWQKGAADAILDNLVADGKMVPSVIVMPNGRASSSALSQAQQAAVNAMNQALTALTQTVSTARTDFVRATYASPANSAQLSTMTEALRTAELHLATARAEAFSKLQTSSDQLNPRQVAGLAPATAAQGARGGGTGGGQNDDFAAFEADLLQDVIPYVESHYSVRTDRVNRALMGLSMGGGQTLNFGLAHLDRFAWVAAFSPAPNTKPPAELIPNATLANEQLKLLWLSCGDRDTLVGTISRNFLAGMQEKGVNHMWHVDSGGHTWPVWKNDLYIVSQRLFR